MNNSNSMYMSFPSKFDEKALWNQNINRPNVS